MAGKLTVTRGLPGSGKTTWAKAQEGAWRVNRDDIRAMFCGVWDYDDQVAEGLVSILQRGMIKELLGKEKHVIVDDTNLDWRHVQALSSLATGLRSVAVQVDLKEFLHVPLEECIRRDAARLNPVGSDVITAMYIKYLGE